jgi:hypothetical protein
MLHAIDFHVARVVIDFECYGATNEALLHTDYFFAAREHYNVATSLGKKIYGISQIYLATMFHANKKVATNVSFVSGVAVLKTFHRFQRPQHEKKQNVLLKDASLEQYMFCVSTLFLPLRPI